MRILYLASTGPADATRASIPFHLAVNGSAAVGQEAVVVLAGDATEFLQPDVVAAVTGVGLPPLQELFDKARHQRVPIHV